MKVLDSRVLIQVDKSEEPVTKIGSIELKTTKEWEKAKVIYVGEAVKVLSMNDEVLIYPGAGKEIIVDGEKYRVISSAEIIVIL